MEDSKAVRTLLESAKTIAVVGMSDKPDRDSNEVGRYLKSQGYRVIPVNPSVPEVLGERSYPSLQAIPSDVQIDIVDVFRKSDAVPGIVNDLLQRTPLPKALWLQLGVTDAPSGAKARQHGVLFIENQCIMIRHRALFPG
jgi:predicted CoA-binding protein